MIKRMYLEELFQRKLQQNFLGVKTRFRYHCFVVQESECHQL